MAPLSLVNPFLPKPIKRVLQLRLSEMSFRGLMNLLNTGLTKVLFWNIVLHGKTLNQQYCWVVRFVRLYRFWCSAIIQKTKFRARKQVFRERLCVCFDVEGLASAETRRGIDLEYRYNWPCQGKVRRAHGKWNIHKTNTHKIKHEHTHKRTYIHIYA